MMNWQAIEIEGYKRQRLNKAIDYINHHVSHEHTLEELASYAHYSPFHFLRSFRAMTNQTPLQYLNNHRLDRAAKMLIYNNKNRVSDVAASCGFTSPQHFSRTFKTTFGITPRDASGNINFLHERTTLWLRGKEQSNSTSIDFSNNPRNENDIDIFELPDFQVGYLRTVGPYSPQLLEDCFDRMLAWIDEFSPQSMMLGIPRSLPGITPHWRCIHEVCGILPDKNTELSSGMSKQTLNGGLVAVYRADVEYQSLYQDCRKIWTWLTHSWLPSSPFQPDDRPAFETYLRDLNGNPSQQIEFCLPIRHREKILW